MEIAMIDENQFEHIKKELEKLQKASSISKMLPFFFNLILYIKKGQYAYYQHKIISPLTTKFPSRIIFIIEDDYEEANKKNYLDICVQTMSSTNRCEIIFINVSGSLRERIPFLIYPNLISDLPIYLLWTLPISPNISLLKSISKLVSRIIFDANSFSDLREFFLNITSCFEYSSSCIADLSWTAISSWRKLLSNFFDSSETLQGISSAKKILITYISDNEKESPFSPHKIQSLYLQAWLITSLNFQLESFQINNPFKITYINNNKTTTEVVLQPIIQNQFELGSIQSIKIFPSTCHGTYYFQRVSSKEQISLDYSKIHNCKRCTLPKKNFILGLQEGLEIVQEVFFPPSPAIFFKSFNFLKNLFEKYNDN